MVLVVDEDQLVAGLRVGQAHPTRGSGIARLGNPPHRALLGKLGIGQLEEMGETFGRQAGDAKAHGTLPMSDCDEHKGGSCAYLPGDCCLIDGALTPTTVLLTATHSP